jgi:hypothetical protein
LVVPVVFLDPANLSRSPESVNDVISPDEEAKLWLVHPNGNMRPVFVGVLKTGFPAYEVSVVGWPNPVSLPKLSTPGKVKGTRPSPEAGRQLLSTGCMVNPANPSVVCVPTNRQRIRTWTVAPGSTLALLSQVIPPSVDTSLKIVEVWAVAIEPAIADRHPAQMDRNMPLVSIGGSRRLESIPLGGGSVIAKSESSVTS